jgi:hypothetical protein
LRYSVRSCGGSVSRVQRLDLRFGAQEVVARRICERCWSSGKRASKQSRSHRKSNAHIVPPSGISSRQVFLGYERQNSLAAREFRIISLQKRKTRAFGARAATMSKAVGLSYSTPSISAAWRCRRAMRRSVGGCEAEVRDAGHAADR